MLISLRFMRKIKTPVRPTVLRNAGTRRLIVPCRQIVPVARPVSRAAGTGRAAAGRRIFPAPRIAQTRFAGNRGLTVPGNAAVARRVRRVAGTGPAMRIL